MPGMTVWPFRSITRAPAGAETEALAPIRAMRPFSMMIVWASRAGAPVPSMTRTFVSATTGSDTLTNPRVAGARRSNVCAAAGDAHIRANKPSLIDRCIGDLRFFRAVCGAGRGGYNMRCMGRAEQLLEMCHPQEEENGNLDFGRVGP